MIPADGTTALEVEGGLALVALHVPALPIFPVLTGAVAVERGVAEHVGLGVRYTTWLGFDHRLGPEVAAGRRVGERWTVGARVHPWLRIAGTAEGPAWGGDVSAQGLVVARYTAESGIAAAAELGGTTQFLLFERLDGQSWTDGRPWYATTDVAVELAWPDRWAEALAVRVEAGIPRAPDDPFTVLGVRPRIVLVGQFGL